MAQTVKWLPRPEKHDFQAAEDYLSLIMPPKRAAEYRKKLAAAQRHHPPQGQGHPAGQPACPAR